MSTNVHIYVSVYSDVTWYTHGTKYSSRQIKLQVHTTVALVSVNSLIYLYDLSHK